MKKSLKNAGVVLSVFTLATVIKRGTSGVAEAVNIGLGSGKDHVSYR